MLKIANESKLAFIMGDFNINLLNYENDTPTGDFINNMFSNQFQPFILQPTRVTDSTTTLIDNIFSNDFSCKVTSGNVLIQISDHFPQFSILQNSAPDYNNTSYYIFDYKNFDSSKFLDDYQNMNFDFLETDDLTTDNKFGKFLEDLNNLVDSHCPKKKLNKKSLKLRNKSWINTKIQRMMRIRDRLLQQFKQSESSEDYSHYKQFRNRVVNELKTSKSNYYQNYFAENKANTKLFWKGIKSVIKTKTVTGEALAVSNINDNGVKITDPVNIANNFKDYFLTVADKITKKIPRNPGSPLKYLNFSNNSSFFISPTTPNEVSKTIQSLKKARLLDLIVFQSDYSKYLTPTSPCSSL